MDHSAGELEYIVPEDYEKIIIHQSHPQVKEEPITSAVYTTNIGNYSQDTSNSNQFVKIETYNIQGEPSTYAVVSGQRYSGRQSTAAIKCLTSTPHSSTMKSQGKSQKYAPSSSYSSSSKSKPHTSTQQTVQSSISRRRKPEKAGKGLRHFSMKVCEKVKEKGATTYNEVADELVAEEVSSYDSANCDQKNIRRRVYDALNVLMAMNIISKDKKEIRWIGLPTNSVEQLSTLQTENQKRSERIEAKQQQLRELLLQVVSFKNLVERNKSNERQGIIPTANSSIQLPFIIVNTHKSTKINCSVTNDKSEYFFKFNDKFEIHDDVEVLKRMGLLLGLDKGECTFEDIDMAKSLVPKNFGKYIEAYGRGFLVKSELDDFGSYVDTDSDMKGELDDDDLISETSDFD